MAKTKTTGSVPNRHLYSRLSYLHQAAAFLGSQVGNTPDPKSKSSTLDHLGGDGTHVDASKYSAPDQLRLNLARHLLTDLRVTSLKSQIRLSPAIKHTICKFCDTLLIEGETSTSVVENKSKGCKKPWADILVVKCNTCNGVRRFPVQAPRQKRRPHREQRLAKTSKGGVEEPESGHERMDIVINDD